MSVMLAENFDGGDRWAMRLQKPSFQPSLICYHPLFVTQQDLIKEKFRDKPK